jgi:type IV secretory pathway VirJ component
MSSLMVAPEAVSQAAGQLGTIGSELNAAHVTAAPPTTGVLAPAADEVSAAITALMGTHAQQFQAVSAQMATFHNQFVGLVKSGAGAYVSSEATNAQTLGSALKADEQAVVNEEEAVDSEASNSVLSDEAMVSSDEQMVSTDERNALSDLLPEPDFKEPIGLQIGF